MPDHSTLLVAGRVLSALGMDGVGAAERRHMINDVMIAVSATRAGAEVVTSNASDFERIAKFTRLRWMTPEA